MKYSLLEISSILVAAAFVLGFIALAVYKVRQVRREREAERQLAKARETIANNRETAGLRRIPFNNINVNGYSTFDLAQREYVGNPASLLKELKKLNAGLNEVVGNGCMCNHDWELIMPGYNVRATIPGCASFIDAVSDEDLAATINALSDGGLHSDRLVEGTILKLARNLARKAADAKAPRPGYEENRIYIGAVLQDLDGKVTLRRGRNEALAEIAEAEKDAREMREELLEGIFEVAFMTDADTIGVPVKGQLTAIVLCAKAITVYE